MGFFSRMITQFKPKSKRNGSSIDLQQGDKRALDVPDTDASSQPASENRLFTAPAINKSGAAEQPPWGGYWLECLVILLAVTAFCAGFLDLQAPTRLPGNESEVFQMLDWTLVNSLRQYHAFPLWNIYIQSGLPYVADPMLHVYNPFVTLPVLLFGVRAGFKLGIYFSFLMAALGMWRLARTLGMGRAARLWTALMFAFAGQPVARFLQGQYLFVLGFAYIPWIISSLILITRKPRKRDVAIGVASLALLFFSGNAYYSLFMLMVIGLFVFVMVLSFKKRKPYVGLNIKRLFTYIAIGVLAIGVIAIQLLPTAEFWPRLSKDLNLAGSQTVKQIFLDYTSKDSMRPDAYSQLPAREEFYAYIGLAPFISLILLPLAVWKGDRKLLLFFGLIVLLTVGWITLEWMPWRQAFINARFLLQFRHLLRILVLGSFAIIILAGLGLDSLWKFFSTQSSTSNHLKGVVALTTIGLVVLGIFMLYAVLDVFRTNRNLVQSQEIYAPAYRVMSWVRQNDLSDYYVRHNPVNAWQEAVLSNHLRYLDAWYHFADIRVIDGKINERFVQAQANYLVESSSEPVPDGAQLIAVVDETRIFSLPQSLPLVYQVDNAELQLGGDAGPLVRSEVTPLTPFFSSPNSMEVIAEGSANQTLVVMMTRYPGWQVLVDGKAQLVLNVSGYLAVAVQPGVHKYVFIYSSRPFFIGLVISLVATVIVLWLFFSDIKFSLQEIKEKWKAFWKQFRESLPRLNGGVEKPITTSETAVYSQGLLQPSQPLDLPDGAYVSVIVEPRSGINQPRGAFRHWVWASGNLIRSVWSAIPLQMALFAMAIGVYLAVRLIGLVNFPIYFFTDEAVQTVMAEDFVKSGFKNYNGEFLPTYFNKDPTYNLSSVSVYVQVIPYLLFGKSVYVTRAVSVLIGTLGALAVGLILRDIFKLRYWWTGVLLLSIAPAWFLHSRTAFETVEMTAFYAGFLYFYLRYRYISPRALYGALVMGALVFYTYSPGQLIIVVTGVFLLFSDLRYHWQNRKTALWGLLLLVVLVAPYIRYSIAHPQVLLQHLSTRAPYWSQNISLFEKLRHYFSDYLYGLNPAYWFFPNQHDLDRHLMKGYGHLLWVTLPLFAIGVVLVLLKLRSSSHRTILFAMLAAPSGSALVGIGITRILVFIIPAVVAMSLGLEWLLGWIERGVKLLRKRRALPEPGRRLFVVLSLCLILIFGVANFAMLRDALVNGPTWYQDYTLAGMQYGASQLFGAINEYIKQHPQADLLVTPNWTNGADAVAEFFLPPNAPVRLGSVEGYLFQHLSLDDNLVFVMLQAEMDKVTTSGKFKNLRVDEVLPYPNGQPGFYFAHMQYVDNIDEILTEEQKERSSLQQATITIQGEPVQVGYSMLDMGSIDLLFDGDLNTVARTLEANPFVIELNFPKVHAFSGYKMILGSATTRVSVFLYPEDGGPPIESIANFEGSVSNPELDVDFELTVNTQKVRFEVYQPYSGVPANVHVWEVELK